MILASYVESMQGPCSGGTFNQCQGPNSKVDEQINIVVTNVGKKKKSDDMMKQI